MPKDPFNSTEELIQIWLKELNLKSSDPEYLLEALTKENDHYIDLVFKYSIENQLANRQLKRCRQIRQLRELKLADLKEQESKKKRNQILTQLTQEAQELGMY